MSDHSESSSSGSPARSALHEAPQPEAGPSSAPHRYLPKAPFSSVEYPGPVSQPSALLKVINQEDLDECFNASMGSSTGPAHPPVLEMSYRMGIDPTGVPVRGARVPSQKLLLKVVKRRRRRRREGDEADDQGIFTTEVLGPITSTVRFRSMADWHYTPDPDARISQIITSLRDLDYDAILDYSVPPLDEHYIEPIMDPEDPSIPFRSLLDLQPTPIFSERRIPPVWNYKPAAGSVLEEVEDTSSGQTRQRLVNRARFAGVGQQTIGHGHTPGDVPTEPIKSVKQRMKDLDPALLQRLRDLLEERPVWQRGQLLSRLTDAERYKVVSEKIYLPAVSYSIGAGPYWKSLIRFGYDPCVRPEAYKYQRIYFYLQVNRSKSLQVRGASLSDSESSAEEGDGAGAGAEDKNSHKWWQAEQERRVEQGLRPPLDPSRAHIFDGQILHLDRPDYQLCDITDPLIARYIHDPANLTDVCDPRDGWYKGTALNLIKALVKIKYAHVRETGEPAPDSLCYDAITEYQDAIHRDEAKQVRRSGTAGSAAASTGRAAAASGRAGSEVDMQVDAD